MYIFVDKDCYDAFTEEAKLHGITEQTIVNLVKEAKQKRRGIVLTLSHRLKKDFKERANRGDDQRSVVTSGGLSLEYITGIKPLGQYEQDRLEKFQKE